MLRPGLHFGNACGITPADMDIIERWKPLSLLLAMDNIVREDAGRLREAWELAGRPPVVLRHYYHPEKGGPARWGAHATESVIMAQKCVAAGIPASYLVLKPFNEPNMPTWANWEGFGDQPEDMERYNRALNMFIDIAKNELPDVRIGGPHLTVGNHDVKFSTDPPGVYYYHGEDMTFGSSPCSEALSRVDVHFVHTYGMAPGQYKERAHGLRFLEYEKYLAGKDIYIVEGAYGISSGQDPVHNTVRGEETVAYLRLLGERYPQVKGIALWIGGDRGWFAFRHSEGADSSSHRPVVFAVEEACREAPAPSPPAPPAPSPSRPSPAAYTLLRGLQAAGIEKVVDLREEIESFSDMARLHAERRDFRKVRYIVVHHSGYSAPHTVLDVAKWHVLQKTGDRDPTIPYHFCIDREGRLFFTARLVWTTYHCYGLNRPSVGLCLLGDLTISDPSPEQLDTLRRLIYALGVFFGGGWDRYRVLYLVPHGAVCDTACPGRLEDALVWEGEWPDFFRAAVGPAGDRLDVPRESPAVEEPAAG